MKPWLETILKESSRRYFNGREAVYFSEGGSIPFMATLSDIFPDAQFLVTGVLGPGSNAHGRYIFIFSLQN